MWPKITRIEIHDGFVTMTCSQDALTEILEAIIRQAYNEGYDDGAQDNIKAD